MLPAPGTWASTEAPRKEGQLWGHHGHQIQLWGNNNTGDICNFRKPELRLETASEQEAKLCKWRFWLQTAISQGEGVKLQCRGGKDGKCASDTGGKLQQE